jgi:hypothetical protein
LDSTRIFLSLENTTSRVIQTLSGSEIEPVVGKSSIGFVLETARYWNIAFFAVLIIIMLYLMIGRNSKNSPD